MSRIETRLAALGLTLPEPLIQPPGAELPFPWVSVRGSRVLISGHAPVDADGTLASPRGQVGRDVTLDEAKALARNVALAILRSLRDELGALDRITGWVKILGMVNSAPGFNQQPHVINGFTELIVDVFGPDVGRHARSAVGMSALPFDIAVEIEGEVEIAT